MNTYVILAISMAANLAVSLFRKAFSDKGAESMLARHIFNAGVSLIAAIVLFVWSGFQLSASLFTVILGIIFGLIVAIQHIANLQAVAVGPLSYTTVIISLSTLIPALSGTIIWKEPIAPIQIVGIALLVVCLVLSVNKDTGEKKASVRWLIFCGIAFLFCGLIGVMQKWHQSSSHADEINAFLVIAFIASFLYSAINAVIIIPMQRKKENESVPEAERVMSVIKASVAPFLIFMMLVCGAGSAINHKLNLYLSGVMPSAVFFPIVNGGGLILVTICAVIFFKERLSVKQWIGLAVGIVSVVLLCNPF